MNRRAFFSRVATLAAGAAAVKIAPTPAFKSRMWTWKESASAVTFSGDVFDLLGAKSRAIAEQMKQQINRDLFADDGRALVAANLDDDEWDW